MFDYLEKNPKFAVIITIIIALEIFVISSIPGVYFASSGIDLSLVYHLMVFFLLNFFFILSVSGKRNISLTQVVAIALFFSTFYAILDELHQVFVPGRFPSFTDVLVDVVGILWSSIIYSYYKINIVKEFTEEIADEEKFSLIKSFKNLIKS